MQHDTGRFVATLTGLAALLAASPFGSAHHSTAEYDAAQFVEARGEVVSVIWRNPHVRFQVSTKAVDGNDKLWDIESADLTRLDRAGLPRNLLNVGDTITFAGNPSTRTERRMYVTNLLVADGRELLLRGNVKPRWTTDRAVNTDAIQARAGASTATPTDNRFFERVFVPSREGQAPAWLRNPPLTAAGRAGKAAYDEVVDDPVLGCVSPGMPRVMLRSGPYAVRFIERGSDLILQNEWFEIDRVIHMNREPAANEPYTPLGYSAGRWDGDALVITTTHIDWPYFELYGLVGVPQSRQMRIVERFTPRDGNATLQYDWSATDPVNLTETISYENYVTFRFNPSLDFLPYDCVEDERRARNAR
jgi:hypothetical protein